MLLRKQSRRLHEVKTAVIEKDQMLEVKATQHINYMHVISGSIQIAEHTLHAGDAIAFLEASDVKALEDAQVIWFDLPEVK